VPKNRIPAITVAPIGMGAALLNFLPGQMTFEQYFGWQGQDEMEKACASWSAWRPPGCTGGYLVDPTKVDLRAQACAFDHHGLPALRRRGRHRGAEDPAPRGKVLAAPHGVHFDGYRNKLVRTWRPGGHRNPLQQLMLALGRRQLAKMLRPDHEGHDPRQVLDLARWAPSGDNTQPWRFEIVGEHRPGGAWLRHPVHCVYDLDGKPSQISLGALFETMAIAASAHGLAWQSHRRREGCPTPHPTFDIEFVPTRRSPRARCSEASPAAACSAAACMSLRRLDRRREVTLELSVAPRFDPLAGGLEQRSGGRAADVRQCQGAPDDARGLRGPPVDHRMGRALQHGSRARPPWAQTRCHGDA
jgi:hypothetical protein